MCAATADAQVKISALPAYPGSLSSTVRIPSSDLSLSTTQSYYLTTPQIQSYLESLSNTWSAQQNFSSSMVLGSPTGSALGPGTLNAATGVYVNGTPVPTYPQTAAEIAAGVTPTNYGYPPGDARRYGASGAGYPTDDTTALQNAINVAQQFGGCVELAPGATYYITSGLQFKQGKSSTDTQSYSVCIDGNGATIQPAAGISYALQINPRCLLADVGTGRAIAPIIIKNLFIDGGVAGATGAGAILIGTAGYRWDAFNWDLIQNVTVQDFQASSHTSTAVMLLEGRHAILDGVDLRAGASLDIQANTSGSVVGDFVIRSSEFSGSSTYPPVKIEALAGAQARGIKIVNSDIYGGGTTIHATGASTSQVGDIWFTNDQFDTAASTDVFLTLYADTATSELFNVHVSHDYFVNGTMGVYVHTAGTGSYMAGIDISHDWFSMLNVATASPEESAILALDASGVSVDSNKFDAITGTGGASASDIVMDTSTDFSVNDNVATNDTAVVNGIATSGACTRYSITGNMMAATAAVTDGATGTPVRQLANNLTVTQ